MPFVWLSPDAINRSRRMTDEKTHDKARDLAEKALDAYVEGDQKKGDTLADKAAAIDPSAIEEIVEEMDDGKGDAAKE